MMFAFRWLIGGLAALLAAGALLSFALYLVLGIDVWQARARTLRRGVTMALLLWFNVEVWGQIASTIIDL